MANKNTGKALVCIRRGYNGASVTVRVVNMKRSRTEVGRWRMLRQASRRKARWLEGQSRRNMRIHTIRNASLIVSVIHYSLRFTVCEPEGHRMRCPTGHPFKRSSYTV